MTGVLYRKLSEAFLRTVDRWLDAADARTSGRKTSKNRRKRLFAMAPL
jgi:hypothetical protein